MNTSENILIMVPSKVFCSISKNYDCKWQKTKLGTKGNLLEVSQEPYKAIKI